MATAFVVVDSHYNKDSDGEMDEHRDDFAWVFPEGLDLGRPAQYWEKRYRASGFPRYGSVDTSKNELLAEGKVASIDGARVTFTWDRAAAQRDEGSWQLVGAPAATLLREEEQRIDTEGGGRNEFNGRRRGWSRRDKTATQRDGYRIRAPEAAWAFMRNHRPMFVATLVSSEVQPDGQLAIVLTTIGGEEIRASVAQNSSISAVAALLREQRGLDVEVQIVSPLGAKLAPQATVLSSCI